jgi:predicted transposase YdaD
MIGVSLEETRVYQEAKAEGKAEGTAIGKTKGKLEEGRSPTRPHPIYDSIKQNE